jgi:hypothetical protein
MHMHMHMHMHMRSGTLSSLVTLVQPPSLTNSPQHTHLSLCRGVSFNAYFNDFSNYTNAWLHQLLEAGEAAHHGLAISVQSWQRQRQYVDWALEVGSG